MGLVAGWQQRPAAIVIVIVALHLCVGFLLIFRDEADAHGDLLACSIAVPAVLAGGWVFQFSPSQWGGLAIGLFVAGGTLTIISLLFLGRCFAILPAVRGTVTRGPFSVIRHPAYLGELLMVAGCLYAIPANWIPLAIGMMVVWLVVIRIQAEERLLLTGKSYEVYAAKVRWRLIPLVW
jgi:protein-S-isoprenylcysteine O-methyltransferase Ste14